MMMQKVDLIWSLLSKTRMTAIWINPLIIYSRIRLKWLIFFFFKNWCHCVPEVRSFLDIGSFLLWINNYIFMRKNANACEILGLGSEQFLRESFLLCPIHTHVKNWLIFIDFFRKNGEEISYCTKSSLVIFVRKQIHTVQQKFVWFRCVENLTPRSILLVSGTFFFQKIHSIGWMLVLKSNIH